MLTSYREKAFTKRPATTWRRGSHFDLDPVTGAPMSTASSTISFDDPNRSISFNRMNHSISYVSSFWDLGRISVRNRFNF